MDRSTWLTRSLSVGIPALCLVVMPILLLTGETEVVKAWVANYGPAGLFIALTLLNVVVQPVSPDLLIIAAPTVLGVISVHTVALVGGTAGLCSGFIAYQLGRTWGSTGLSAAFSGPALNRTSLFMERHGLRAVAITAITPIPFSLTCWLSGAFRLPFVRFIVVVALTRSTRHVLAAYFGAAVLSLF